MLNKSSLDTPNHNRVDLLTDLGKKGSDGKALAEADGVKELVNKMTWPGRGGTGYKFELRYAEHFQSQGYKVVSVDSKVAFDADFYEPRGAGGFESWFRTDLDLHLEKGGTAYHAQVKSSNAAVNSPRGHRALKNYFGASAVSNPASKDILAIPAGTTISDATQDILEVMADRGREVIKVDALTP